MVVVFVLLCGWLVPRRVVVGWCGCGCVFSPPKEILGGAQTKHASATPPHRAHTQRFVAKAAHFSGEAPLGAGRVVERDREATRHHVHVHVCVC
jgi:hypothetical protein